MTLEQFIEKMRSYEDCTEYTAASGKKCYRTFGDYNWYILQCVKLGIEPKFIDYLHYEAKGDGFTLEYVEHDIILAID